MKHYPVTILILFFLSFSAVTAFAAEGDSTIVRSHDQQHMKFPPGNRTYTNKTAFPNNGLSYRKILMQYTLGCPGTGCSGWDYTTTVRLLRPTGALDSTLNQLPDFTVGGMIVDSSYFTLDPTYTTFFDAVNMVTDSTQNVAVQYKLFGNSSTPAVPTDSFFAYTAGYYNYYHDASGVVIDSNYVMEDSIRYLNYYDTYDVFEVIDRIELAKLITPYFGEYYPYTFTFDVTDYAPILKDTADISLVFDGWQDGFLATLDFIFIEGTPPRDPKRVISLYNGSYQYGRVNNPIESHLVPKDILFDATEQEAQLNFSPSGHSFGGNENCAEFCAKNYMVMVNGTQRFRQLMWRDDCAENPLYPQGGTWIYDRANWCPGLDVVRHSHQLTPYINFGQENEINIDFDPYTYDGSAAPGTNPNPSYNIDGAIITYGAPNFNLDACIDRIIAPNNHVLQNRHNPICGNPIVQIKNEGATALTSLLIEYGPKGGQKSSFEWTGNLGFLETEIVELPEPDWTPWGGENQYEIQISSPNGGVDEHDQNDFLTSTFDFPDVMPGKFVVEYRSSRATENQYSIRDDQGNLVFANNRPVNNQQYSDTLELEEGCYRFLITDAQQDGLRFFGSSTGQLLFRGSDSRRVLKSVEPEFGAEFSYQFTVGYNLTGLETPSEPSFERLFLYPNPSRGVFTLEVQDIFQPTTIQIEVFDLLGRRVYSADAKAIDEMISTTIDLSGQDKGLYTVVVRSSETVQVEKLILE